MRKWYLVMEQGNLIERYPLPPADIDLRTIQDWATWRDVEFRIRRSWEGPLEGPQGKHELFERLVREYERRRAEERCGTPGGYERVSQYGGRTNRYAGTCARCGRMVEAGAGTLSGGKSRGAFTVYC